MLKKILGAIENKRDSDNSIWRNLVAGKDAVWHGLMFYKSISKPDYRKIETVNFALTYLCNSRCTHCNIWKNYLEEPGLPKNELTLDEIKTIFSSKYFKGLETIALFGGEPTIREDFSDIVGFFVKQFPHTTINITTNAIKSEMIFTKLNEIVEKYSPKNLDVTISLDGDEKTHDEIRGIKGNYKSAIKLIKQIKTRFSEIGVSISFTIMPKNYGCLEGTYELAKEMNADFGFQFAQVSDFFYKNKEKEFTKFNWKQEELAVAKKVINKIRKDIMGRKPDVVSNHYMKNIVENLRNKREWNCYSGTHSCFLDSYGDVYPCIMLNKKLGNAKNGFDAVWESQRALYARKTIHEKKCSCWTPCEAIPSIKKNPEIWIPASVK